jgi:hypothetical protein
VSGYLDCVAFVTLIESEKDLAPYSPHTGIHIFNSTNPLQPHLYLLSCFLSQLFHKCAHDNLPHLLCNVIFILILTLILALSLISILILIDACGLMCVSVDERDVFNYL